MYYFLTKTVYAQKDYQDLSPLDGFTVENADSFGSFLNNLFVFGLGIAGILALIMIVYGGIQYMGSESVFNKDEGKKRITAAIGGLILALLSIVILNTINPNIVDTSGNFKPPAANLTEKEGIDVSDPESPETEDPQNPGSGDGGDTPTDPTDPVNPNGNQGDRIITGSEILITTIDGTLIYGPAATFKIPNASVDYIEPKHLEGLDTIAVDGSCNNCEFNIVGFGTDSNGPFYVKVEQTNSLNEFITGSPNILNPGPNDSNVSGKNFENINLSSSPNTSSAQVRFDPSDNTWVFLFQ